MNFEIEITFDRVLFGISYQKTLTDSGTCDEFSVGLFFLIFNILFYDEQD